MKEGDRVWLEGRNLSIAGNKKLSPKRYGPFLSAKNISPVAYKLRLPPSMKIHDVFHIDLLLPYKETEAYGAPFTRPPPIIDSEEEYEVETILKARRHGRGHQLQYLVHWKGYPCRNSLLCGAVRGDLGLELEVTVEEGEVGKVDAK